ncbi:MAG: endonuclease III [Alphaproteobacteria bacterium]|nr:endonuclease III [Alphaproteobacteria bacterium]
MRLTPEVYFKKVPKFLQERFGNLDSELFYINEFTFAVAVILSAQATDKKVNEITPALFAAAPDPFAMLELGEAKLKQYIKQISFFNNKARHIIGLSRILSSPPVEGCPQGGVVLKNRSNKDHPGASRHPSTGGELEWRFPKKYHNQKELMALPGIGRKTANVIMNVLWGAPLIGVDTHVMRNAHRYGWVSESDNTPEKIERALMKVIPKKYHAIANHVMVLHGRYICIARKPKCDMCPVRRYCDFQQK